MSMTFRRFTFWAHLISGLIIGLVIFTMAVTGIMLAYEPQIVGFAEKNLRFVSVPETQPQLSLEEIVAVTKAKYPERAFSGVTVHEDPASSVMVQFGRGEGVFVNPYTGEELGGISKTHDFMHVIEDIHRKLALGDTGKLITGICTIAFLFMVISGIYLWWPRQWTPQVLKTITRFNPELKGRSRDWNWHNVIGFWTSPVLMITILTGLIMSFAWANNLLYRVTGSEPPPAQQRAGMGAGEKKGEKSGEHKKEKKEVPSYDLAAFLNQSKEKMPNWKTISLRLPKDAGGPVSIFMQSKNEPSFYRSQLTLDSKTNEVKKWEPFSGQSAGRKARSWVKYIHTGEAGGVIGQTVALISASGVTLLVWTGFALAWRRFFVKNN